MNSTGPLPAELLAILNAPCAPLPAEMVTQLNAVLNANLNEIAERTDLIWGPSEAGA